MSAPGRLRIVDADPSDPGAFAPFHEVYEAALRHGPAGEFSTVWQVEEIRASMADPDARNFRTGWIGWLPDPSGHDRAVTIGWMAGSNVDNTDLADVLVCCTPGARGHGHAAEMLAHVEEQARARGRSRLVGEVVWPYADGPGGTGSTDLAWATRQGFELALVDVQRRLSLPVPAADLDALAAEAASHHDGYALRSFSGPVPDDLVEGWAALTATLSTEAPMGDIAREQEAADVGAVRAEEALLATQGRVRVGTVALSPDGEAVAYSDLVLTIHESERAYQWGTLVLPAHRGHRLGLAVKVANLRRLQETEPQISTVVTFNADVNAPMVSVNDRLGFRPVQWMGELQKKL
ncbi:GNAT family N-acetyltransferase [Nocardioides halotolerans]|uniref:GNAT family N-acetyltransferase n=1 Tax=Nocardioides halotolerans TaxID=433660 RepID=UPI000401D569|nr:GNAT family N-acetyltransferase [Nocardioides halotolerans]